MIHTEQFKQYTFRDNAGNYLKYLLSEPEMNAEKQYPLVIYLHSENGPEKEMAFGTLLERHCYVVVPQCPSVLLWDDCSIEHSVIQLIQEIICQKPVNPCRIYILGFSMGAMGVWNLIAKHPQIFAAAIPISGFGMPQLLKTAKFVPVWAFHAADDPVISVSGKTVMEAKEYLSGTRNLVAFLRNCGSEVVQYTEYEEAAVCPNPHDILEKVLSDKKAVEWLFAQDRTLQYEIHWVKQGVWHIEDFSRASFYLIEGATKALLIDTGCGGGSVKEIAASLTRLPVELAVTHVHHDHFTHSDEFEVVYMHKNDIELIPQIVEKYAERMQGHRPMQEMFIPVKEGDLIDLGGGTVIEVVELAGHTPGSVVFIDRKHRIVATGDAIGSGIGVWNQSDWFSVKEYQQNLRRFRKVLKELGPVAFLVGHRSQDGHMPGESYYNPVGIQLVEDMIELCEKVLEETIELEKFDVWFGSEQPYRAEYKTAAMNFQKSSLQK